MRDLIKQLVIEDKIKEIKEVEKSIDSLVDSIAILEELDTGNLSSIINTLKYSRSELDVVVEDLEDRLIALEDKLED